MNKSYRETKLYRGLTPNRAEEIASNFDGTVIERLTAWQWLHDHGFETGYFGRQAQRLIEGGYIAA